MATNISDHQALSKFGALIFARRMQLYSTKNHPGLLERFGQWRARRAAQIELSSLSDRELSDIGLTRQEIPSVVRNGR